LCDIIAENELLMSNFSVNTDMKELCAYIRYFIIRSDITIQQYIALKYVHKWKFVTMVEHKTVGPQQRHRPYSITIRIKLF